MSQPIADAAMDTLFREARTYSAWQDRPVTDQTLHDLYELLKWAPTSANAAPARFAFLRSTEARERLRPALAPLNVEKTMSAPVTVIVAYDLKFYDQLPKLFPHSPGMKQLFERNPELVEATAKRNSSLQGAYLILAARALGLDCGPMQPGVRRSEQAVSATAAVAVQRGVFVAVERRYCAQMKGETLARYGRLADAENPGG